MGAEERKGRGWRCWWLPATRQGKHADALAEEKGAGSNTDTSAHRRSLKTEKRRTAEADDGERCAAYAVVRRKWGRGSSEYTDMHKYTHGCGTPTHPSSSTSSPHSRLRCRLGPGAHSSATPARWGWGKGHREGVEEELSWHRSTQVDASHRVAQERGGGGRHTTHPSIDVAITRRRGACCTDRHGHTYGGRQVRKVALPPSPSHPEE